MNTNLLKYIGVYLVLFLVLFFIYFPHLYKWTINGDELIVLDIAENFSLKSFLANFVYTGPGHYQPLIFPFLKIYQILLSSFANTHLVNLVLFTFVPYFLFICLRLLLPTLSSLLLAIAFSLSPIFYFHIFAINAVANTVMLLINLCLVYFFLKTGKKAKTSYLYISIILFILSIFIKETFLINFYLIFLITYLKFRKNISKFLKIMIPLGLVVIIYFFFRSKSLATNNIYYKYIISFYKLRETTSLFVPWLFNFPKGWQYGVKLPASKLYLLTVFLNIITVSSLYTFLLIRKQIIFVIVLIGLIITLLPYIFLSRILVFHFDQSYLIFFLGIAYSLSILNKTNVKASTLTAVLILFIPLLTVFTILPQWTRYSFVGESNEIASNFIQVITKAKIESYDNLCIVNHFKGSWPTDEGRLANYISKKPLQIFSSSSPVIPKDCLREKSLVLKNEDRKYLNITQTKNSSCLSN